ncbi:MAG: alpha/beta fold hydrolase [Candidatus Eremiobacteraeota bacterium]|nr:alpha/beta fold hydrolase [Candidatus Eremiobacteraeota bacterium]
MQIAVDDANIDVEIDGNGDAVVLLHGFPLTRAVWELQASHLASHARVIRPDLRGMGMSSVPDGPYLMETLASDVAAVLDALGISRATIVGHSLGGYVAMAFARMFTERVERLALICSKLNADTAQAASARELLADKTESSNSIDAVIEEYLPKLLAPQTLVQIPEIVQHLRGIARQTTPKGAAAMLRGMAQRVPASDIAGELTMPVLVVGGGADQSIPAAEYAETAAAFPRGRLQMMNASGHVPMLEEPDVLSAALVDFLR